MLVQMIKKNLRSKISLDCPFKMAERTVSSPVSQIHIGHHPQSNFFPILLLERLWKNTKFGKKISSQKLILWKKIFALLEFFKKEKSRFAQHVADLGTRQHSRDNVTSVSGQKIVAYCIMSIFVAASPFRQHGLHIFWSQKLYYVVALSLLQS